MSHRTREARVLSTPIHHKILVSQQMISLNPFRDISHCDDERRHLSWTNKTCGRFIAGFLGVRCLVLKSKAVSPHSLTSFGIYHRCVHLSVSRVVSLQPHPGHRFPVCYACCTFFFSRNYDNFFDDRFASAEFLLRCKTRISCSF